MISWGRKRSARARKPACSGSATAAAISPFSAVSARASSSSAGSAADSQRAVGHQPRHQPLAKCIVGGRGEEIVMAEPGGDARTGDVGTVSQLPRPAKPQIHSATRARARSRAASVPSARRSLSQLKPWAAASRTDEPDASLQPPDAANGRRRRSPVRHAAAWRRGQRHPARDRAPAAQARPGPVPSAGWAGARSLGVHRAASGADCSRSSGASAATECRDGGGVVGSGEHRRASDQRVGSRGDGARTRSPA